MRNEIFCDEYDDSDIWGELNDKDIEDRGNGCHEGCNGHKDGDKGCHEGGNGYEEGDKGHHEGCNGYGEGIQFKKGKHTHATREDLDNVRILQLRAAGRTLTQIGEQLGCSPSTVRNRLNKLRDVCTIVSR